MSDAVHLVSFCDHWELMPEFQTASYTAQYGVQNAVSADLDLPKGFVLGGATCSSADKPL